MRQARFRAKLTALLLAILLFSGCWDRREVEDIGFVHVLGVDWAPENQVTLTVQIALPRSIGVGSAAGGTGSGGDAPPVLVERVTQPTMTEALRDLETFSSRRISLVHLKAVIFGEEMARTDLRAHLGILTRPREMRRNIMLLVAEGKAEDLLTVKPEMERDPGRYVEDLTRRAFERTARAPRQDLHEFLLAYETHAQDAMLPLIQERLLEPGLEEQPNRNARLLGTAVFRGDRMIGKLSAEETETLLFLTREMGSFIETIPAPGAPDYQVAVELTGERRSVEVDISGPLPRFHMHIHAEAELREIEEGKQGIVSPEGLRELEQILSHQLQTKSRHLIEKLQQEHKADLVGFGQHLKPRFVDWPSWVAYRWKEKYPTVEIEVSVDVSIRRVGMTFQQAEPR